VTVRAFMEANDPTRIDLHNKIDLKTGVRYLGRAWCDVATGRWLCLADVGALCVVEVRLIVSGEASTPPTSDPKGRPELRIVANAEELTTALSDPEETLAP
jgi:hypothetical protein